MSCIEELLEEFHNLGYQAQYDYRTFQLCVRDGVRYATCKVAPFVSSEPAENMQHFERVLENIKSYFEKLLKEGNS